MIPEKKEVHNLKENKYTLFLKQYSEKMNLSGRLNDDDLEKVTGGVGGANEATCPQCGKPMSKQNEAGGPQSDAWFCSDCNIHQFMSDADYIEILKAAESTGQTQGLVYPVWWDKVKH